MTQNNSIICYNSHFHRIMLADSFALKVDDDYTNIYDAWWALIDINNEMFRDTGSYPMNL